ncbi:hypothetical protein HZA87_02505 [Candidatus Uhrbacteria bacterium]|nr:hypothetical protein [Candidatus Uhrbacteria bacterium]
MGLFGKLLGRENARPQEAPVAEKAEVKVAKEVGKERVDKMVAASREAKDAVMKKAGSSLARVGGALRDAFFATIGGAEKGGKATVKGAVEAGRATAQYASETKAEAGELARKGIEAGNKLDSDVAAFLKDKAVAGVDSLNKLGDWGSGAMKELSEKTPAVHADAKARMEKGALDVGNEIAAAITEGVKQFMAFKEWASAAKKEFAQKRGGVHQDVLDRATGKIEPYAVAAGKFIENVVYVKRDAQKEYGILKAKADAAKDRFIGSVNDARLKVTGTAELKGEIGALREQVTYLTNLVEAKDKVSSLVPESSIVIGKETVDAEAETVKTTTR